MTNKTMRALVFDKPLRMADVPMPEIRENDEARIRVKYTGICGTDIHILRNEYPAKLGVILGHETTGIVEAVGSRVRNVKPGDNVILDPTYHCNICDQCRNDLPNYCAEKGHTETGVSSNGTFAEHHVANANFLYPLPEGVSFETGTLAEPLACVLNALRQTTVRPESRVLVVGSGPIGLLFALATSSFGCETTIGDISPYRIAHAKSLALNVQDYSVKDILQTNSNRRFDLAIDTSGRSLEKLLHLADKGGELLTAGLDYSYEMQIKPSFLTDNGIKIIGSIDSNLTFAPAIKMLRDDKRFARIITHSFPIEQYEKAFGVLGLNLKTGERGNIGAGKVVISPESQFHLTRCPV